MLFVLSLLSREFETNASRDEDLDGLSIDVHET